MEFGAGHQTRQNWTSFNACVLYVHYVHSNVTYICERRPVDPNPLFVRLVRDGRAVFSVHTSSSENRPRPNSMFF